MNHNTRFRTEPAPIPHTVDLLGDPDDLLGLLVPKGASVEAAVTYGQWLEGRTVEVEP